MSYAKFAAAIPMLALAGCQMAPVTPDPTGRADAEMVRVLAAYQASGAKPVATLTVEQARAQPTMSDAATAVAKQAGMVAQQHVARVYDTQIPGAAGPLQARVYDPQTIHGGAPVILYFHGGGWVTGTLDTYDATDRVLANSTGAIVVSLAYRLAPEAKFPAAQDDADAAYGWLVRHASSLGGNPRAVAVAGESAGGNLAIDAAIWARDNHKQPPIHELLIYPVAGTDLSTSSYNETVRAVPLNRAAIQWYVGHTTTGPADLRDPRLSVVGAADLHGLPPTTIISAEIDPLRSEDQALAQKFSDSGNDVQQRTYPGVTHEFFGMGAVVAQAKQAELFAAGRLLTAFSNLPPAPPPGHHRRHAHHSA